MNVSKLTSRLLLGFIYLCVFLVLSFAAWAVSVNGRIEYFQFRLEARVEAIKEQALKDFSLIMETSKLPTRFARDVWPKYRAYVEGESDDAATSIYEMARYLDPHLPSWIEDDLAKQLRKARQHRSANIEEYEQTIKDYQIMLKEFPTKFAAWAVGAGELKAKKSLKLDTEYDQRPYHNPFKTENSKK